MSFIRVGFFFGREFRGVRRKVVVVGVLGSGKVACFSAGGKGTQFNGRGFFVWWLVFC